MINPKLTTSRNLDMIDYSVGEVEIHCFFTKKHTDNLFNIDHVYINIKNGTLTKHITP